MMFELQARTSLVVYVSSLRQVRQLKRYGHVDYVSKRMRYAVIYMNDELVEETVSRLKQLKFVRRIVRSPRRRLAELLNLDQVTPAQGGQSQEEDEV
ncbi:YlbG family protein [Secundilactobacillus kimchicus]|nr:YlbG family protein [Secundilactobacillus kimchicus]MBT9673044.1 DUF2129 domain-containing protein [Secundilactobacillus kimchicus]